MSIEFYTSLGIRATALIKKYGRMVPLRRRPYGEQQDRNCWIVRDKFDPHVIDGELIEWTDHRYIMASDVDPPPEADVDRLVVDGKELRIVKAPPVQPAEVVLIYDIQARL